MANIEKVIEMLHERGVLGDLLDKRVTTNKIPIQLYIKLARAAAANNKDISDSISTAMHVYTKNNNDIHDSEIKAKALLEGKTPEEYLVDVIVDRVERSRKKQNMTSDNE
ncbi:hypothetical protein [Scytonema sp. NUACC26]|uniref:hypothetical protein n=1 Tax=Scytonema sp. NUACC26 TaxID=3140176 RepID=UPI0038B3C4B2